MGGGRDAAPAAASSRRRAVAIDLAAGTAGGICQLLVGHPFDTLKTKLQSQGAAAAAARFAGPGDALVRTVREEGVAGLYRGMGAPLATVALFNAVLFASRGAATAAVLARRRRGEGDDDNGQQAPVLLSTREQLGVALAASAAVSLVATPTELLKCRLQAQGDPRLAADRLRAAAAAAATTTTSAAATSSQPLLVFRGPLDVARHVLRHERPVPFLPIAGLYKGLFATFARETLGNVSMFGVYNETREWQRRRRTLASVDELPSSDVMLAGGLGGTAFWFAAFPSDLIKSKLQTEPYDAPKYRGFWDCAVRTVRDEGGWRALWRGFTPALLRSFPANAVCFAGFEYTKGKLERAWR
jgi:solute carrier family 25 (mitochondrial carnitine/acylcarnitine transporter), member 20/29